MRTRKRGFVPGIIIDLVLALLICALYFATSEPDAVNVMAGLYYAPVYRGSEQGKVAFQFPLTWDASALDDILAALDERKVTFAVSGEWAEENPDKLKDVVLRGHEIATMGYSPDKDGSLSEVMDDITSSVDIIKRITGEEPVLYYSGTRNSTVSGRAAKRLNLTQVLCTVDLMCARGSALDIIPRVSDGLIDGSIILIQPTRSAAEALVQMLKIIEEKGMTVTYTSDVLE